MASADRPDRTGAIARRFGRRAREYERHAHLQREAAEALFAFAAPLGSLPGSGPVVEIGCGTGLFTALACAPAARGDRPYLATDIAPEMVTACRAKFSAQGATQPGMAFAVLDGQEARFGQPPGLVVSNLTFQWFADPMSGILRLAGQARALAFSVLVAGSFPQWHQAFADLGRTSGLIPLPQEQALLSALAHLTHLGARLRHQVQEHTSHYESARAFVHSFRGIGADHPRPGYRPAPIRPVLKRFEGGMDATARVLYCVLERHNEAGD